MSEHTPPIIPSDEQLGLETSEPFYEQPASPSYDNVIYLSDARMRLRAGTVGGDLLASLPTIPLKSVVTFLPPTE